MNREKLFKSWTELSHDVKLLGEVLQNPVELMTADILVGWLEMSIETDSCFSNLSQETMRFLLRHTLAKNSSDPEGREQDGGT